MPIVSSFIRVQLANSSASYDRPSKRDKVIKFYYSNVK